ncbi:APC family permease [Gordonia polyisoprenivorans]|uniref:APC family permease n=1 Tax=Gordonia polyisoprenivorans TaxID=84595 RepID=UPI001AD6B8CC|nr:APC family permease [Gordonia polyisoprenivorans]QTI69809.1 APC family permease [Gordonia polyisoprenivorans]
MSEPTTPSSPSEPGSATPSSGHLNRVLGLPELIFFGLAYMVPLTVFTTYGVVTDGTEGHLPGAYVITLATMIFTALSYGAMVRIHPVAGSAYSYTQRSFGGSVGFAAGWALLLDYIFLPMINFLVIGIFVNALWPAVPAWVWVVASIAVVTALNVLGIKMVTRFNYALIVFQVVFIVVFVALAIRHITGDAGTPSIGSVFFGNAQMGLLFSGAAILCLSFLGFDAISTLSEETRDPRRLIPRAILLVTVIGGGLFIVVSLVASLSFPDYVNFTDVDSAANDVMVRVGGTALETFFTAAYVAGCFASALASQASVGRILYAMGRDATLPKQIFGRINARFATPANAIVIVGAVSLVALTISLSTAAEMVSFGALVAFSMVNLSVIKIYLIEQRRRSVTDLVRFGVLPLIGFGLTMWLWTSLSATAITVGLVWLAVGVTYLIFLTRGFRRPAPTLDMREESVPAADPV